MRLSLCRHEPIRLRDSRGYGEQCLKCGAVLRYWPEMVPAYTRTMEGAGNHTGIERMAAAAPGCAEVDTAIWRMEMAELRARVADYRARKGGRA